MKKQFFFIISFILVLMSTTTPKAEMLKPNLHKKTLDNGLTVLVKETPGTKAVTVQLWVKAGSIYEGPDEGGITHLIEHMIFKGTDTEGAGDLAAAIEEKGGQINAYTSFEYTVYHATLAARYWETALEVLTDALLHSIFDPAELEREKQVVLEEVRMRNDRPQLKMFQALMTNSYSKHPYRLPIIGSVESVSSFSRDDIIKYMDQHYQPENFTVVIVGDVRSTPVIEKVQKLYGDLPAKKVVQQKLPAEPKGNSVKLFQMEDDISQSQLALTLPIPSFSHEDTPVIDVISSILGHGDASRLYHRLRDQQGLVYNINASAFTPKGPGLFELTATLEHSKIAETLEVALTELYQLKYVEVEPEELARVKHNLESDFIFALERVEGQARVIGSFYALTGDPTEDEYLNLIRAVSRADIIRVANKYFTIKGLTAGFLVPNGSNVEISEEELLKIAEKAEKLAKDRIPTSLISDAYLSNSHRFKLDNGITLLVREDSQVPTVAIRAIFPGGLRAETQETNGAFAFISDLLPRGTKKLGSREFSLKLADMAGDISGFNGKNTFGVKGSFLSKFFSEGMALVRDVIVTPAFDPEEAEKIRPERIAALKQQDDSLPSQAFKEFNRILFQSHPYALNTAGSEAALSSLSAADLQEIYQQQAKPQELVLAVAGNIRAEEVYAEVNKMFGSWQQGDDLNTEEEFLLPEAPDGAQIFTIARDKEQVHIIIGFLGATLHSEDRFALEVLDTVLSGQSGRLFRQLRDVQSLAYSLSSFSMAGLDTGAFGIYIGTSPDKKEEAIQSAWKELYKLRETPITEEELEKAKNVIIGHYELNLQTHGAQAMEAALNETYNLGQDFGHKYIHEISQITVQDVQEAARKYIQTNNYVLVTVGAE